MHEFGSSKSIAMLRSLHSTVWRLGFSATPFKENDKIRNMNLTVCELAVIGAHVAKGIFGPLLCDITTESLTVHRRFALPIPNRANLQSRSILADAQVRIYKVTQPSNIKFLQPWAAAEEAGIVQNAAFNRQVADIVNSIPEGRIMILVRRLAHGMLYCCVRCVEMCL